MSESGDPAAQEQFRCDFCGLQVRRVRRIALDRDYDRLQKPHRVQYACPECSERKERARAAAAQQAQVSRSEPKASEDQQDAERSPGGDSRTG